jgi:hypothetical protein
MRVRHVWTTNMGLGPQYPNTWAILPLSPNKSIPIIHASQTFLSLINFIEKSNNIYDIK